MFAVAASSAARSATSTSRPPPASCVVGLKQPGQPSVQPCIQTTNRAPGPFARLRASVAWMRTCTLLGSRLRGRRHRAHRAGRLADIDLFEQDVGRDDARLDAARRNAAIVRAAGQAQLELRLARVEEVVDGHVLARAEHVLPRADRYVGELRATHELLAAVGVDA